MSKVTCSSISAEKIAEIIIDNNYLGIHLKLKCKIMLAEIIKLYLHNNISS